MKKSEQPGLSKKTIKKLLGWVKDRMVQMNKVPDMDGKKDILQVTKC